MNNKRTHLSSITLSCCVVILLLTGCEKAKHPGAPVQEVGVVTLRPQKVAITLELPGRTTAVRVSDVRPQVGVPAARLQKFTLSDPLNGSLG